MKSTLFLIGGSLFLSPCGAGYVPGDPAVVLEPRDTLAQVDVSDPDGLAELRGTLSFRLPALNDNEVQIPDVAGLELEALEIFDRETSEPLLTLDVIPGAGERFEFEPGDVIEVEFENVSTTNAELAEFCDELVNLRFVTAPGSSFLIVGTAYGAGWQMPVFCD